MKKLIFALSLITLGAQEISAAESKEFEAKVIELGKSTFNPEKYLQIVGELRALGLPSYFNPSIHAVKFLQDPTIVQRVIDTDYNDIANITPEDIQAIISLLGMRRESAKQALIDNIKVLVDNGLDQNFINTLKSLNLENLQQVLAQRNVDKTLLQAVLANDVAKTARLLQGGRNTQISTDLGRTLLHIAAEKGYAEIVELLLRFGANRNSRDKTPTGGLTPLERARIYAPRDKLPALEKLFGNE